MRACSSEVMLKHTVGCYVHYVTETLTRTHPGVTLSLFVLEFTSERPLIDGVFLFQSQKLRVWLIYWLNRFFTKTVHSGSQQVMTSFPPLPVQEAGIQLSSFPSGWDHNLLFLEKLHLDIKSMCVCVCVCVCTNAFWSTALRLYHFFIFWCFIALQLAVFRINNYITLCSASFRMLILAWSRVLRGWR